MKKDFYLRFAILGLVLPYYFFYQFRFNIPLLFDQLFANHITTFFAVDLVISIIVFWVWMFGEAIRLQMKNAWVYILASLVVGLSFALPLFLYFRERELESQ